MKLNAQLVGFMIAVLVVSTPTAAHARQSGFSGKGAVVGAAVGAGIGLIVMAVQHGRDKDFRVRPNRLEFPETHPSDHADQVFVLRNTGTARLRIRRVAVGLSDGPFSIVNESLMPAELPPGAEMQVTVRFRPRSAHRFSDAVDVHMDKGGQPVRVRISIRGKGTAS